MISEIVIDSLKKNLSDQGVKPILIEKLIEYLTKLSSADNQQLDHSSMQAIIDLIDSDN